MPLDGCLSSPLPSINADLKEIKKPVNGLLSGLSSPEEAPLKETLKKREKKKVKIVLKPSTKNENKRSTPLASRKRVKSESSVKTEPIKTEIKKEEPLSSPEPPSFVPNATKPINGTKIIKSEDETFDDDHEEEMEEEQEKKSAPGSPTKNGPVNSLKGTSGSPSKLGLPDSSGLIVGVNTINYDASSSVRNKAKSREERKMEMIMKAFEAMEKAEQRKKDTPGAPPTPIETGNTTQSDLTTIPDKKRRRSSSSYKNDSNLEASSADEAALKPEPKRNRKKGRNSSKVSTPQRRRSRVMSGGSMSNMSADETPVTGNSTTDNLTNNSHQNGPFRFPKTKKSLMSDWLQESETSNSNMGNDDDDVSANYLKGSRSPPGIATHLLRSAVTPTSPVKNVCSAKKRWLRQAISEDHSEDQHGSTSGLLLNGSASPSLNENEAKDMVTPLKKRRLANYKEDQELQENEELVKVPNGLKKQILQNLVLEAVLDKAMEDMLATDGTETNSDKKETKVDFSEAEETEIVTSNTDDDKADEQAEVKDVEMKEDVKVEEEEEPEDIKDEPLETKTEKDETELRSPEKEVKIEKSPLKKDKLAIPSSLLEPNSAFKSFFNSNVSLEALEAEIAASQKQRESVGLQSPSNDALFSPVPTTSSTNLSENESSEDKVEVKMEDSEDNPEIEHLDSKEELKEEPEVDITQKIEEKLVKEEEAEKSESEIEKPIVDTPEAKPETKPKTKKRVSLADYKSLRRTSSSCGAPTGTPTTSSVLAALEAVSKTELSSVVSAAKSLKMPTKEPVQLEQKSSSASTTPPVSLMENHLDDPGTPTQDEPQQQSGSTSGLSSANLPPKLSTLPLFEKLDKLELAHQEIKRKGKVNFLMDNSCIVKGIFSS